MSFNPQTKNPTSQTHSFIRSRFSEKVPVIITFPKNSPYTKQEFADECNINILLARYMATGEMPAINEAAPQYLDATGHDYQEAMNFIAGAKTLFNELPSHLRLRFDNDPAAFLEFTSQEKNRDEMLELGLLKPRNEWVDPSLGLPKQNTPASISEELTRNALPKNGDSQAPS